jgi:hypothetical protein
LFAWKRPFPPAGLRTPSRIPLGDQETEYLASGSRRLRPGIKRAKQVFPKVAAGFGSKNLLDKES